MSMLGMFRRVPAKTILELRAKPERVVQLLNLDATAEQTPIGDAEVSVGTAWHGLHFLLTGSGSLGRPPLNFILAGPELRDVDAGKGPVRTFASAEVRRIATALALVTPETLSARFDAQKMNDEDVYPANWDTEPDALPTLLTAFETLKQFIAASAEAEAGMLIYLA